MNLDELLAKTSEGRSTPSEIAKVAERLEHDSGDKYILLMIIGRSMMVKYKLLVESFLNSPSDPMLARLSLQILCRYWNFYSEYVSEIHKFMRKVEWDEEEDVRLMAISCAGEAYRVIQKKELLELLLEIYRNPSEDQTIREAAYCAMGHAVGKSWKELPPASRHFDLENDIDKAVIEQVHRMIAQI